MQTFIESIELQLGTRAVLKGDQVTDKYASDWAKESPKKPIAVLLPRCAEEVSKILQAAIVHKQALVVQGGLTGLSGGATPKAQEISISLEWLNNIQSVDTKAMTMTVEAGVTLETVQNAAKDLGLLFPLDIGARGSCTIGGNIATNAGGNQVIRYGMMRNLVLGLEAVLPDGTVINAMNTLLKNNAGFDLKHLIIGSEGTLGVVTRAVLRLFPQPKSRITVLCGVETFDQCITLLNNSRQSFTDTLSAFEVMWDAYYQASVLHSEQLRNPFDTVHKYYVLVEICGDDQDHDRHRMESFLSDCIEKGVVANAVVAQSEHQANDLWGIRDGIAKLIEVYNFPANFDVGISLGKMEEFVDKAIQRLQSEFDNIVIFPFGHIGDGNIHLSAATDVKEDTARIYDTVYKMCADYDVTISAEHGIGVMKKPYLSVSRTREEIQLMKNLKSMLDPTGILNPGRVI